MPTKWFYWRALTMLLMFSVFATLFFKDGIWGYREKNLHFYVHRSFIQAGVDFQRLQNEQQGNDGALTEAAWKSYAAAQKVELPDDAADVLPRGAAHTMEWPTQLVDGFVTMDSQGGQVGALRLWEKYTASRKDVDGKAWGIDPGEQPMSAGKIRDQFIAMAVALVIIITVLFFLIRTMRRNITVDNEALYTQDGRKILYKDMVRIDKRKWETKGVALVYYMDGGQENKAKVDGLVYGQFKENDGAPAEKLFAKLMENFKGEVLEYVSVDDGEGDPKTAEEEAATRSE